MLFRAHLLSPCDASRLLDLPDGAMVVDSTGRIEAVGSFAEVAAAHPGHELRDLRPHWILPGLVDLHSHLPQHPAVAMDGQELLPWLNTHIFPAEIRFADPEWAALAARTYFRDQLALGTTTTVVYGSVHQEAAHRAFQEAERCGIRGVLGKVMMDQNSPGPLQESTAASLAQSEELCATWHGRDAGRLQYAFTPRFAPTCSMELLRGAGRLAEKHGAFVQTHLSENLDELQWVHELFPAAKNYTDVYARAGLLGPRTLLGHGIHLAPSEREVLRAAGATIVHCPRSNAFLKSGIMPLRRWLDEGLGMGLGTDVGGGPSLDLWAEMAMACTASKLRWAEQQTQGRHLRDLGLPEAERARIHHALRLEPDLPIDPTQAFALATLGGARALGLGERIGSLEAGKEADFIVVDPARVDPAPHRDPEPAHQVLDRLVYRSTAGMIRASYVRGRLCYGQGI
ncbi:MAG: guanine deaminase [Holophaga sp.]|nr:guanine deaminase [Holophaga sp.]